MKVAKKLFIIGSICTSIALTGCSNNGDSAAKKEEVQKEVVEAKEVTVKDSDNRELTFTEAPQRIVSLTSGDLSIVDSLGVKAVGRPTVQGDVKEEWKAIEEVGNVQQPNLEKITSLKPDLIIAHADFNKKHLQSLEATGAKVYLSRANSVADIEKTIETIGLSLGKEKEAKEVIAKITGYKAETGNNVKALILYGTPGEYFAALPESLPGDILKRVGGQNIANDFPKLKEMPQYAKLSMEGILAANPDVIYLLAHGDIEVVKATFKEELKKNVAWENIKAVKDNKIEVLPTNVFSVNPGANVVEALDYLSKNLQQVGK